MSNNQVLLQQLAKANRLLRFYDTTIEERFMIEDIIHKLKKQIEGKK